MKKRIFALIMAMCLALSLLPASVFAENESDSDVVYGKYGTGTTWTQDNGIGTIEYKTGDGNTITLSKKATPLGDNTYRIDLEVKTTQTTTTTPPGAAATVLVIDTSGSMDYCSDCGQENSHADGCKYYNRNWRDNSIKNGQTRLAAAKEAAISFLDAYKGDTAGVGRYVSLVSFAGSASVKCDWQDVSTTAGYNAVVQAIRSLSANGGTNLDAGLSTATNQFTKSAVSGISKDSKNVIALTDGIPTYYGNNTSQHGSYGCPDTNKATAASAAKLKESASLYTVCFGAANDRCWTAGSTHDWEWTPWGAQEVKHDTEGPLVGDFLRDSIATSATADTTYAYNAANSAELFKAFKAITTSITTGISSGTVNDPMGPNISVTSKPDDLKLKDGSTYTWELANGVKSADGSKTTYTYQLSYMVKLDTTGEGFDENAHYPTNGKTTFTSGDKTFEFPVPGVKGTIPSYQVKYEYKGDVPTGALAQLPADETHKMHTDVTVAAEPKLDGYVFSGWTTTDAAVSSDGKFKMPGQNVTLTGSWTIRSNLSYTVNYYWNGTTDSVAPSKTVDGQTFGAIVTEKPAAIDGYTAVSADSKNLAIGTGTNEINFYYYKNVTLTANSDIVTYDGKEHSVSGFTGAPDGADFSAVTVGAKGTNVGTYPAQFPEGTVGTVDATEKYIVAEANDGKLTITPRPVTITAKSANFTYDGQTHTLPEAEITGLVGNDAIAVTVVGEIRYPTATPVVNEVKGYEFTAGKASNYSVTTANGELTMSWPTAQKVVVTANSATRTYDGTPLTDGGYTVEFGGQTYNLAAGQSQELANGDVLTVQIEGSVTDVEPSPTVNKIVSVSIMNGTTDVHHIYNVQRENGKLQVTPMPLTVTAGSDSKVYDGTALTKNSYTTSTDPAAGDTLASVTVTGSQTDVGSSDNVASDAKLVRGDRDVTANYAIKYLPGTLTVTKNESAKLTAEAYKGVYDGGEHDAVVKTALSDLVDDSVWTYSYSLDGEHYTDEMPQVKNVGTYPVWVKATNDNYVDLVTVVTAEVTPATVLVTADSHEWIIAVKDTCVSDPEPALTYQAESPVAGETPAFSGELSREPGAERGKTYQILQGDLALADGENFLASNYVLQFVPGELTVKARDITITKTVDVTKAFVGDKLTYTITVTNTGDVDLQDVAVVDEMLGIEQVIGELKAGESWTQQFTYTAQESDAGKTLVNTAVTGTKDEKTFDQVDSDGTEITQKPVPTGDQSMVGLWTATLLISAAGAAIILARKSRRSK